MHPSFAHRAEYAALRSAVAAAATLSFSRAGSIGEAIGRLVFSPFGIRRRVVERQLEAALGITDRAEIERIARAAYGSLGRTSVETAILPSRSRQQIIELFEDVQGWSIVEERLARGKGLIVITGHLGNWELAGAMVAAHAMPIDVVVRLMGNPLFDQFLSRTRARLGMTVIRDRDAVRQTARSLRAGRVIAFLADQSGLHIASSFINFFGRPAKTPRGPAVFALRLDAPLYFGACVREPDGRYRIHVREIAAERTGDTEFDVDAILNEYSRLLEQYVRETPEQYFWQHRRWKRQPADTPAELRDPV